MARDTGYPIDITARRRLGQNARPRDGQPRSGLAWFAKSGLCDTSRPEMDCAKPKPAAKAAAARASAQSKAGPSTRTGNITVPALRSFLPGPA